MQTRTLATKILYRAYTENIPLARLLDASLALGISQREQSFLYDLCFGVMRWHPQLDFFLTALLKKPLHKKNTKLKILCWLGLYQIIHQRTAEYGAVSATVNVCDELAIPWGKAMVNAVLRNSIRKKKHLINQLDGYEQAKFAHPQWLINRIKHDWPNHWRIILDKNNRHPPMTLRVNQLKISRNNYQHRLAENQQINHEVMQCNHGIVLEKPCDVQSLPGFNSGLVSVQDGAAQLAVTLMDLSPGLRILDACAAPGGKSCHILEAESQLQTHLAIDIDPKRLNKIEQNLDRLDLRAKSLHADATTPETWWDGYHFDRILLDVPCSATGIIRRHPDIKLLRNTKDIDKVNVLQAKLLTSIWPLLKPGGRLVYATCSVLTQENDLTIHEFLQKTDDSVVKKIDADWGHEMRYGRQILPGQHNFDGFYFSCLIKRS